MSQLLLEFFCEEIPARMQARAEADLERLITERLKGAGLTWDSLQTFSGPRRLGLVIEGLPAKTEDVREERKGPKVGAPDKAIEGFLRSAGLDSLDQCKIEAGKKGEFYVALIEKPGRATADVVAEAVPDTAKALPWPKSMKFGEGERQQRWVRPLQRVICLIDGLVVDTEVFGIKAGNITEGHRVHGSGAFEVIDFADYEAQLRANGVILHRAERRDVILEGARKVCADAGYELVEDQGLLEEVTGLVEHPVPVLGEMDPDFLDLPPEVITLTMKTHQKYFAVRDPKTGELAAKFVVIANQDAPDGGEAIAAGNARVLSARLADARHFWDLDRKTGLEAMAGELSKVKFHQKLGSIRDKRTRVLRASIKLSTYFGADKDTVEAASRNYKSDLVSQMVYEFPELQGIVGGYISELESGNAKISSAIRDQYLPAGPSDPVPSEAETIALGVLDRMDTLVAFWVIQELPTGSKDPFALRRAALGVVRLILKNGVRVGLKPLIRAFLKEHLPAGMGTVLHDEIAELEFPHFEIKFQSDDYWYSVQDSAIARNFLNFEDLFGASFDNLLYAISRCGAPPRNLGGITYEQVEAAIKDNYGKVDDQLAVQASTKAYQLLTRINEISNFESYNYENRDLSDSELIESLSSDFKELHRFATTLEDSLLAFFADRLKVHLKDEGVRHDVIDAVFALGDDDLVRVTNKARALQAFLDAEAGAALLAGYRRAANILAAEEKKGFDLAGAFAEALGHPPSVSSADTSPAGGGGNRDAAPISPPVDGGSGPEGRGGLSAQDASALLSVIRETADADEEHALIDAIEAAEAAAQSALSSEDFEAAMAALAQLRGPVDAFFEAVVVNAEDAMLRRNRLLLLSRIRAATDAVADFSRLEG
jgi:glycyl-tRNA synthetase beta chain